MNGWMTEFNFTFTPARHFYFLKLLPTCNCNDEQPIYNLSFQNCLSCSVNMGGTISSHTATESLKITQLNSILNVILASIFMGQCGWVSGKKAILFGILWSLTAGQIAN